MAATQTTLNSSKAWAPDKNIFNPADAVPDALILQHSTIGGVIEGDAPALRVAYVTDDTAQFTAEGAEIPEADPGLDEVLVYTAKVTQLVRISNEQYRQDGTANELSQSVQRAIMKKADQAFLTQAAPTGGDVAPPAGILNIAGIENGGAVDGNLDALVDLVAQLESNGGTPTGIILDPLAWASLRKITSDAIDTPQNTLCLVRDAALEQPAEVRGAFLLDVLGITLTYLGATLEAYCTETGAHIEDLLADFGRQQEEQIRKGL